MKKLSGILTQTLERLKKTSSLGLIAIVVALGIILILLPAGSAESEAVQEASAETAQTSGEPEGLELKMESALSKIAGAGRVTVVLTLKSDGETYVATDKTFSDRGDGGAREQSEETVIIGAGSSTQSPVVTKRDYPDYRGALVIADGAGDPSVRLALMEAVMSLTGLGADHVTVVTMQPQ